MVAKKRISAEARKAAILRAVTPLIAERGMDRVTTKELAAAADVSEALLYRHFPSKADILAEIQCGCVAHATQSRAQFDRLGDSTETLIMIVYVLVHRIGLGHLDEDDDDVGAAILPLVIRSLLKTGEFARDFLRSTGSHWYGKVRACAEAAYAAGDLNDEPSHAGLSVWFSHHLAMTLSMLHVDGESILDHGEAWNLELSSEELAEHAVRFCLRGMGIKEDALKRYYRPESFRFLLRAGH